MGSIQINSIRIHKRLVLLFSIYVVSLFLTNVCGQICVQVKAEKYAIFQGQLFSAQVTVNNVPKDDSVKMYTGGSELKVAGNTAKLEVTGFAPGEFEIDLRVEVWESTTLVFSDSLEVHYFVFPPIASIFNVNGRHMYRNMWNRIQISVPGLSPSNFFVSCTGGVMRLVKPGEFEVMPDSTATKMIIAVTGRVSEGRIVSMGSRQMTVQSLPSPEIFLEVRRDSTGTKFASHIGFRIPGTYEVERWDITHWKMSIYSGGNWHYFEGNSPRFTLEAKLVLDKLKTGDKIMLENVVLQGKAGDNLVETNGSMAMTWVQ